MKHLLFSLLLLFSFSLFAQQRSDVEAYIIAKSFVGSQPQSTRMRVQATSSIKLIHIEKGISVKKDSVIVGYVFSLSADSGFVIVSGDERTKPVLGYSTNSVFDAQNTPAAFKYWMQSLLNEIELQNSRTKILKTTLANSTELSVNAISPLLGNIKWNQNDPYNKLCPLIPPANTVRSVTGCVATGMAQVMKYHKWPVSGSGIASYTSRTNSIPVSVTLTGTNYDWTNMTDTYTSSSTDVQKTAVSTLMYHCGAAVQMDYGETSSATSLNMCNALKTNFGYDQNLQRYFRDYYSRNEWQQMVITELNAARPVIYAGDSNEGGHLFVCDGYDGNGYFHINWGWGGSSNGYFLLSALDPDAQGIGGGIGGYNSGQEIFCGVQKPNANSKPDYVILCQDTLVYSQKSIVRNGLVNISAVKVYNKGVNSISGTIGVGIYDSNGVLINVLASKTANLIPNYGWSSMSFSNISIPTTSIYPNGIYKIYLVYKDNTETEWRKVRMPIGTPGYIQAEISSSQILFSTPSDTKPALLLESFAPIGSIYQNKTARFAVQIKNNGAEYNSVMGIYLESYNNQTVSQLVTSQTINIASGETRTVEFSGDITVAPGRYYLATMYDPKNNPEFQASIEQLGNYMLVDVVTTPATIPVMKLTTPATFANAAKVDKKRVNLTASVQNTGGFYDKKLIAFIFETTGGSSLGYLGYQTAYFDTNESHNVSFTGELNLPLKNYMAVVYYQNENAVWTALTPTNYGRVIFTLVDEVTGIDKNSEFENIKILRNQNEIEIISESLISNILICDISGKILKQFENISSTNFNLNISELPQGVYLMRVNADNYRNTIKILR